MGELHIVSESSTPFKDRGEAGLQLGQVLTRFRGNSVVLGIPRGGVVIAKEVARVLGVPFDIVLSRKLGSPGNPELAIGAVSESGKIFLNDWATAFGRISSEYVQREKTKQLSEIARRQKLYRGVRPKLPLSQQIVIVVDDGVATGATMEVTLGAIKEESPAKIIVALPVAPRDTLERLARVADETFCLQCPRLFMAVGYFYQDFEQVTHDKVLDILKNSF